MSRIYFRGGMSPLDSFSPGYVLNHNVLGTNSGNFLYLHGVLRALTMEDSELQANYYRPNYLPVEEVNERFDYFIIPLADAFREKFARQLDAMTSYIKDLRIPCVVTGVGLKAPYDVDFKNGMPIDESVKAFVKAVLDKSACVGVRGELTGEYLKSLGFIEEKDYMPIGCPSMYTHGSRMDIKTPDFSGDARICFNSNTNSPKHVNEYILKAIDDCANPYFIEQTIMGLRTIYMGAPYLMSKDYPYHQMTDRLYQEGRIRHFINVPEWLDFMKDAAFAFGSRLHGNISATISGTPSILVVKDARTRELADYHHLNCVYADDLKDAPTLEDLAASQDFGQIGRYHKANFERFVSFLDKNELKHIYQNGADPEISPLERRMEAVKHEPPILPLSMCSLEEVAKRNADYFKELDLKHKRMTKSVPESITRTENRHSSSRFVKCYEKIRGI